MPAARHELRIEQGASFDVSITYYDSAGSAVNLTSYTARAKFRPTYDAAPILTLTTENGGITLGGTAGTISLTASAVTTAAFSSPSNGVYDLELANPSGNVTRMIEGKYNVTPEATK
jgi:hypothetical protein